MSSNEFVNVTGIRISSLEHCYYHSQTTLYISVNFITSARVCLCVSKITQKVMDGSFLNFLGMAGMAKTTSDSILGVIRKL